VKPIRFYFLAAFIVACDQLSKWAAVKTLHCPTCERSHPVLGRFLALTYAENTGGAFSILNSQKGLFIVVALIAVIALTAAYHRYQNRNLLVSAALALALGGAVGNMIDRIRQGYVVDFFDLKVWPIFNIADSAITVGIALLAWQFLFTKEKTTEPETVPETSVSGSPDTTTHQPIK
jgi:signal peptidase II